MTPAFKILLVEDDENERILAMRAIEQAGTDCEVSICRDGVEACDHLFDSGHAPPSLILLDLKMPKLNGFEVLERIRTSSRIYRTPVVILSSSDDPRDIDRAAELYANSYVYKHPDPRVYRSSLKLLLYYWMAVDIQRPPNQPSDRFGADLFPWIQGRRSG
jgi:CheY-like chemotaxis protein